MASLDSREPDLVPETMLRSFGNDLSVAIVGASGGIGGAFADALERSENVRLVFRLNRSDSSDQNVIPIDILSEESIAKAATSMGGLTDRLDLIIVATGILHQGNEIAPEKSWRAISSEAMGQVFAVNTIGPALVAKHLLPLLRSDRKSAFAALSARVGSISDNELGGWHAYRASKAALNMLIKNFAIELSRRNDQGLCVGLHPGTVETQLSEPFQRGVEDGKLLSPRYSASRLLDVLDTLTPDDTGYLYAWDGARIPF